MEHEPTNFISPDPSPFPAHSKLGVDLSHLQFVLALVAIITIPALVYTFCYSLKCPPTTFFRIRRHQADAIPRTLRSRDANTIVSSHVATYKNESRDVHEHVGKECPICLSAFLEGEEVKQLNGCKHLFHVNCIYTWLDFHDNCPVCRALFRDRTVNVSRSSDPRDDLQQGLPDAASLV